MTQQTRRDFLKKSAAGTVGAALGTVTILSVPVTAKGRPGTPAILGGSPVKKVRGPQWPQGNESAEKIMKEVLYSHKWTRISGDVVIKFEKRWGKMLGATYTFATNGGTSALDCAVHGLQIGPGDEVLVPTYTFIPGAAIPFNSSALPVFVDVDRESFGIDPKKMEEKITEHTKAVIAVHWGGQPCDMDGIMAVARKHNLYVIEDACQAHLAEWRGKKTGTIGDVGCFSHQQSKVLPGGEGGSVAGNDETIMNRCYSWHDYGRLPDWASHKPARGELEYYGLNYKMTEFQGAVLLSQLDTIEAQNQTRWENARYLNELLSDIPGIYPQKYFEGTTKTAQYLYCARYDLKQFSNLPRNKFLKALSAEGIPMGTGMS